MILVHSRAEISYCEWSWVTDSDGVYTTKKNLAKYFWTVVEQRFKAFWNLWNQNQADIMFCNETHFQL